MSAKSFCGVTFTPLLVSLTIRSCGSADSSEAAQGLAGEIAAEVASQPRVEHTLAVLDREYWQHRSGEQLVCRISSGVKVLNGIAFNSSTI